MDTREKVAIIMWNKKNMKKILEKILENDSELIKEFDIIIEELGGIEKLEELKNINELYKFIKNIKHAKYE